MKKPAGITGTTAAFDFTSFPGRVRETVHYYVDGSPYEMDFWWDGSLKNRHKFDPYKGREVRFQSRLHDKKGRPRRKY